MSGLHVTVLCALCLIGGVVLTVLAPEQSGVAMLLLTAGTGGITASSIATRTAATRDVGKARADAKRERDRADRLFEETQQLRASRDAGKR